MFIRDWAGSAYLLAIAPDTPPFMIPWYKQKTTVIRSSASYTWQSLIKKKWCFYTYLIQHAQWESHLLGIVPLFSSSLIHGVYCLMSKVLVHLPCDVLTGDDDDDDDDDDDWLHDIFRMIMMAHVVVVGHIVAWLIFVLLPEMMMAMRREDESDETTFLLHLCAVSGGEKSDGVWAVVTLSCCRSRQKTWWNPCVMYDRLNFSFTLPCLHHWVLLAQELLTQPLLLFRCYQLCSRCHAYKTTRHVIHFCFLWIEKWRRETSSSSISEKNNVLYELSESCKSSWACVACQDQVATDHVWFL